MSESPLMTKSKTFALEVIRACKALREAKRESTLISQFLRPGTSIGANIREAFYTHGKADFVAKLHIALKECSETEYWLELLNGEANLLQSKEKKIGIILKPEKSGTPT